MYVIVEKIRKIVSELSLSPLLIWSFVDKLRYVNTQIKDIVKYRLPHFILIKE